VNKAISLCLLLVSQLTFAEARFFGEPITLKNSTTLTQAIKTFDAKSQTPILIESTVEKVCKSKGCWMILKNQNETIRVRFKGYSFFVPPSLSGKQVLVQGVLQLKSMSLDETKHFAKDAGLDTKKVKHPKTEYQMVATGVALYESK